MKRQITKEQVEEVRKELEEAKKQGDMKKICFWQATLNIYEKEAKRWQITQ